MTKVIINGEHFVNMQKFHKHIKDKLELPDYYGGNLDALWDCLTGWIDMPLLIVWENFEKSKEYLGDEIHKIVQVFKDAEEEVEGFILVQN
ncbi:barstar family protein [Cytobacillus massiliigabonensis]|uniref:barstar family protein n=1 Tax=Cytobacillus massiliigabonensis TaxID=1871011 RepID=UPI000C814BE0|nr:barstar family protein [Cytobacillus massiliigabonensis]